MCSPWNFPRVVREGQYLSKADSARNTVFSKNTEPRPVWSEISVFLRLEIRQGSEEKNWDSQRIRDPDSQNFPAGEHTQATLFHVYRKYENFKSKSQPHSLPPV